MADHEVTPEELHAGLFSGQLEKQGRGRPNKGSTAVRWSDVGLTRKQVWLMRQLAAIPEADFEAYISKRLAERKRVTYRELLALRKNVPTENVLPDAEIVSDLAASLLSGIERILPLMPRRQRKRVLRALHDRLHDLAVLADLRSE